MKITAKHLGVIGIITATSSIVAAGGIAGASPSHGYDDSKKQHGYGDNKKDYGQDKSYHSGYGMDGRYNDNGWNDWEMSNYERDHKSGFDGWYNAMNDNLDEYANYDWSSNGGYGSRDWTPQGQDWQSDWNMWNPEMWWANGSSYENWRDQITEYMSYNRTSLQIQYENESAVSYSNRDRSGESYDY